MKFVLLFVALTLTACETKKHYTDFKVVEFCRELDGEYYLKQASGYDYIGPLNNNGINCTRVLFGR